ncbi:MAG: DUF1015 family protein [Eubacteriales bacterium]|nr:DUF1015 family protein [Eubacteriales bacterium]
MADIRPFCGYRPKRGWEARIAALPYDVYSGVEAREEVTRQPDSFLAIDRAETQFPEGTSPYEDRVYEKAAAMLRGKMADGTFVQDSAPCYYLYAQTMNGRTQTGIVACASIDDYLDQTIKKHENTRADKEADRIRHIDACGAQTGPIFLAYRSLPQLDGLMREVSAAEPVCDFLSEGEIRNRVWVIDSPERIRIIRSAFDGMDRLYIADGHHRCASAVKVGLKRREAAQAAGTYTGEEEFNFFLAVLFPENQLDILPYNRLVSMPEGMSSAEVLRRIEESFTAESCGKEAVSPGRKGTFGLYLDQCWYRLTAKEAILSADPVDGLDVSLLQNYVLRPVFGIEDPRTDERIAFVGGIRGLEELERRADAENRAAFSLYPTSIGELFAVADAGRLMPPKSTWFEPKLLSGLFIHDIEEKQP